MSVLELVVVEPSVTAATASRSAMVGLPRPEATVVGLLWNGKPNGDVALVLLGEQLRARFPGLETRFYKGLMGSPEELLDKAAAECDVVVGCTADCGSCTALMARDLSDLESRGLPTLAIVSSGFEVTFQLSAKAFGRESLACIVVPSVYNNISPDEARAQTAAALDDIVDQLWARGTRGAPQEAAGGGRTESAPGTGPGGTGPGAGGRRLVRLHGSDVASVMAEFRDYASSRPWSDGLPLEPPTPARVDELADAVAGDDPVLGVALPPANGEVTRELLGIAGALAGCVSPEMPVVAALVRAIATMREPARRIGLMSTSAHALVAMLHGPIALQLGVTNGRGCIGPGRQNSVNLRVMRATTLGLRIIGGWQLGELDMDTLGSTRKFGTLFAENLEESPWGPYAIPEGTGDAPGTVSAWFSTWEQDIKFQGHTDAEQLARAIASNLGFVRIGNFAELVGGRSDGDEGILVVVSPPHAHALAEGGFTKEGLARYLFEHSGASAARVRVPYAKLFEEGRIRPEWRWLFALSEADARERMLPVVDHPAQLRIVVAGAVRGCDLALSTFGESRAAVRAPG